MGGGTPRGDAEGAGRSHGPCQESRSPGGDLDHGLAAAIVAAAWRRWVCCGQGMEEVE